MREPKAGDEAICISCKRKIQFTGDWWRHTDCNPRHYPEPMKEFYAEGNATETTSTEGEQWYYQI